MSEHPRRETGGKAPESREEERITREFEYRDSEGKLLGRGIAELGTEEFDAAYRTLEGEPGKARELRSFMILGEKDGNPVEIDLLSLFNPHDVKVLVATEHLQNYSYDDEKKRVLAPPLETPLDVGVLLHELGHADQWHEERFKKIVRLYGREKDLRGGKARYDRVMDILSEVMRAVPEVVQVMDEEGLEQLRRLDMKRKETWGARVEINRRMDALDKKEAQLMPKTFAAMLEKALPLGTFEEEAVILDEDIADHEGDAAYAALRLEKMLQGLEAAGFRFHDADVRDVEIADDFTKTLVPMTREWIKKDVRTMTGVVHHVTKFASSFDTEYEYDADRNMLRIRFEPTSSPELCGMHVDLELEMSVDTHKDMMSELDDIAAEIRELEAKTDAIIQTVSSVEAAQVSLFRHMNIHDIASVPTRMMERDATRRAFQWLRKVRREVGVDFLARHEVRAKTTRQWKYRVPTCEDSVDQNLHTEDVRTIQTTVRADLKAALRMYGADTSRLFKPDDEDEKGITPLAGGRRKI